MPTTMTGSDAHPKQASAAPDRRLLIDGHLVTTAATFPSANPATGEVVGYAPEAGPAEVEAAIAAARRAFDNTDWATNVDLRVRCLEQLHRALIEHRDELAELTIDEVGATAMTVSGPHSTSPSRSFATTPTC